MNNSVAISSRDSRIAAPTMSGPLAAVAYTVSRCVAWIRHRQRIRQSIAILTSLDDHILADIGICRDQVEDVARSGRLPWQDDAGSRLL